MPFSSFQKLPSPLRIGRLLHQHFKRVSLLISRTDLLVIPMFYKLHAAAVKFHFDGANDNLIILTRYSIISRDIRGEY